MTPKQNVIMIRDEATGETKPYRPVSIRLPEFLKQYPVEEYRVEILVQDEISQRKGLLKLYETAIAHGHKPEEVGLPPFSQVNALVFTAQLIDKSGQVLRNPSAQVVVEKYKDRERGETAAFQRLLAQLGFAGDMLDADEDADITAIQGASLAPASPREAPSLEARSALELKEPAGPPAKGVPRQADRLLGFARMLPEQAARLGLGADQIPTIGVDGEIQNPKEAQQLIRVLIKARTANEAVTAIAGLREKLNQAA